MKVLLVLALLSLSTYANATSGAIDCSNADKSVRVLQEGRNFKLTITTGSEKRTFNLVADENAAEKLNEYKGLGTIVYNYYGDLSEQGSYGFAVPSLPGEGYLLLKFNTSNSASVVDSEQTLSCSRHPSR